MALARALEESDVSPEVRRIYADVRKSFDLPLVPTLFKVSASVPDYLRMVWFDLAETARSREFQAATQALEEFVAQAHGGGPEDALVGLLWEPEVEGGDDLGVDLDGPPLLDDAHAHGGGGQAGELVLERLELLAVGLHAE